MRLDELPQGAAATIVGLEASGPERGRLMDLGVVPGSAIVAERTSPLGDPTAYRIRGGLFALRRVQAHRILVRRDES